MITSSTTSRRFGARASGRGGFTLIEILIAIVVLVLGIVGIISLFPTAIESGNKTVEDSYAAAITQSVVDAITVGIRESRYTYQPPGSPLSWTYFLFNHDGVVDAPPIQPEDYDNAQDSLWLRDYCILLPKGVNPNNDRYEFEYTFIYPIPQTPASELEQRSPGNLINPTNTIDNLETPARWRVDGNGVQVPWIPRVYNLGVYRDPGQNGVPLPNGPSGTAMNPGDVRLEFLGEDLQVGGTVTQQKIATDPYPTYSFAFTMRRALIDSDNNGRLEPLQDLFSDSLYEVQILIFKNFDQDGANGLAPGVTGGAVVPRNNSPIREFVTLISL